MFKTQEDNRSNSWNANFIKYFPFEGLKIANISGNLVLSEEGRIFSLSEDPTWIDYEIKEITPLNKYKIKAVYNGKGYILFQTDEGKIFSQGSNYYGRLLIDNQQTKVDTENSSSPMETVITKDAKFCIAGNKKSAVFIGIDPLMSPNRKISADKLNKAKKDSVKNDYNINSFIKNQIFFLSHLVTFFQKFISDIIKRPYIYNLF